MRQFPVVVITGPRQSGKTTLARMLAPKFSYVSLENPDQLDFAKRDPRRFLRALAGGGVIDEAQRCPSLFSYIQGIVDENPRQAGRFVLTGSAQFDLVAGITQSLAGRAAMLALEPLSLAELNAINRPPPDVDTLLFRGLFPALHDRPLDAAIWAQEYVATYLERDVRQLVNIQNLSSFQRFLTLCALRAGQLLNISSLAADAGLDRATVSGWLSVLQASHVVFLVQPWFENIGKRLAKTPKLYFCDTGLAAWLQDSRTAGHVASSPLRGALFENFVMTELRKAQTNAGVRPSLFFLRDKTGHEVDALVQTAPGAYAAVEIKSGETVSGEFFKGLDFWRAALPRKTIRPWVVYGGDTAQPRERGHVLPWNALAPLLDSLR